MNDDKRTVLVTGASGGIGAAVAAAFARQGCRVALGCNSNPAAAEALAANIAAQGGQALVCRANVGDSSAVEAMFGQVENAFGEVEVLVTCAGAAQQRMVCDLTDDDWRQMFAAHADGTFYCCRRALPAMVRKKRGAIVTVASMWGQVGASCEAHYSAAKAAVIGFARALAKEVGPSGVRVNCVAPGAVQTAMLGSFTPGELEELAQQAPLGRLGTPQDIAAAVVWLAGADAAFITGQVLAPNGGMVV